MLQNKRKNLLIVCAGDNSLHPTWLSPERSYDLITIYYGSNSTVSEKYRQISDLFFGFFVNQCEAIGAISSPPQ